MASAAVSVLKFRTAQGSLLLFTPLHRLNPGVRVVVNGVDYGVSENMILFSGANRGEFRAAGTSVCTILFRGPPTNDKLRMYSSLYDHPVARPF